MRRTMSAVALVFLFGVCVTGTYGATCLASGDEFIDGNRIGGDLEMGIVADEKACCELCLNNSLCLAAVFLDMGLCFLKSDIPLLTPTAANLKAAIPGFHPAMFDLVQHTTPGPVDNCAGTELFQVGPECTVTFSATGSESVDISTDFKTVIVTFQGDNGDNLGARTIKISNVPVRVTGFTTNSNGYPTTMVPSVLADSEVQIAAAATNAITGPTVWMATFDLTYDRLN